MITRRIPGVVPRTFIGALLVSLVTSPIVLTASLLHLPKFYALLKGSLLLICSSNGPRMHRTVYTKISSPSDHANLYRVELLSRDLTSQYFVCELFKG
ncbi:hypothetical protein KIW84_056885 [Lathyrus oleraceus]|uniref:Uncharacterized protein n=1 Tax=Pisum sativum TaxID=3888 RepID=A0A9D4X0N3_PEA|nr:hypothetical protein KIW84_056885 [Pisum sativum]